MGRPTAAPPVELVEGSARDAEDKLANLSAAALPTTVGVSTASEVVCTPPGDAVCRVDEDKLAEEALDYLQSSIHILAPEQDLSSVDEVQGFCRRAFSHHAERIRKAGEHVKNYLRRESCGDDEFKDVIRMCTSQLQFVQRRIDDMQNLLEAKV